MPYDNVPILEYNLPAEHDYCPDETDDRDRWCDDCTEAWLDHPVERVMRVVVKTPRRNTEPKPGAPAWVTSDAEWYGLGNTLADSLADCRQLEYPVTAEFIQWEANEDE